MQLRMVKEWKCSYCGKTLSKTPEDRTCPGCGIPIVRRKATIDKLKVLEEICKLNNYQLLIDACAGSGKVQCVEDGELIEGSPFVLGKIAKEKGIKLILIEVGKKTFHLLKQFCQNLGALLIRGDCNEHLPRIVDDSIPTLIFIDPFGYGVPVIKRELILSLAKMPNIDLLINFSWMISREMGFVRRYLNSDDVRNRRKAQSYHKSLCIWWGNDEYLSWGSMKKMEYAEKYAEDLRKYGKVEIYEVPFQSAGRAVYHLIFLTKFEAPKKGLYRYL